MTDTERLFEAFAAGFEESDEQFNADHLSFPYLAYNPETRRYERTDEITKRLRKGFEAWRRSVG